MKEGPLASLSVTSLQRAKKFARGRSPNDMDAFYCSPWAETPTGGQNAVWLRPLGRLGKRKGKMMA